MRPIAQRTGPAAALALTLAAAAAQAEAPSATMPLPPHHACLVLRAEGDAARAMRRGEPTCRFRPAGAGVADPQVALVDHGPVPASNPALVAVPPPPPGYEPVWRDGRINFHRGLPPRLQAGVATPR